MGIAILLATSDFQDLATMMTIWDEYLG